MEENSDFTSKLPSFDKNQKNKPQLTEQNLKTLDVNALTPLSHHVISRQATINIGTIGHVAHGKSTVVKAISGVKTIRFKTEMVRNITIKLGYANAKIFKCSNPSCPRPSCYAAFGSSTEDHPPCQREGCGGKMDLMRHVSFVDCFGLDTEFLKSDGSIILNKDLKVGDSLLGPDGNPRIVKSLKEGEKDLYEVTFISQSKTKDSFLCTGGHLLCLRVDDPYSKPDKDWRGVFIKCIKKSGNELIIEKKYFPSSKKALEFAKTKKPIDFEITAEQFLLSDPLLRERSRLYRAPAMGFKEKEHYDLSIKEASQEEVAWVIGVWLGDGDANEVKFTFHKTDDQPIVEKLSSIANKMGLSAVVSEYTEKNAVWVRLSTLSGPKSFMTEKSNVNDENPFYQLLKKLNLIKNKHIPKELLFHSVSVREAVAAGFIDTDGNYNKGQFDLEQSAGVHKELFDGFVFLIRSLGYIAYVSERETSIGEKKFKKLRVKFNGINVSNLPVARSNKKGKNLSKPNYASQQFTVVKKGQGKFRGFEVEGDGLILLKNFIVAHNCPGHDILMATMLNGAAVMDAALLLIAGNEPCPQPQTSEHLAAVEIMKLKHIIILQNKIDLVKESQAMAQHEDILRFIQGTVADNSPIIPISAQLKYNIDVVCEYIVKKIPVPTRDFLSSPRLIVIRSFDVNKPGEEVDDLKGGVAGGSIVQGVLKLDQEIEVRPGIVSKNTDGSIKCTPIFSRIISLYAEENELQYAVPGGLIGVGTLVDPTLTRADRLVGQVLGEVGKLPEIYTELEISFFLLRRLLGVKTEGDKQGKVAKLQKGEILMVNIGSTSTGGRIVAVKADLAKVVLTSPVCTQVGEKLALSRRVDKHWRLIGWGSIRRGIFS